MGGREKKIDIIPPVTEFHLKRVVSIPSPNVTPSGRTTKFWGLIAMVAPTMHIT